MSIYLLFCGLCRFNRFRHCIGSIDTLQKKYGKKYTSKIPDSAEDIWFPMCLRTTHCFLYLT